MSTRNISWEVKAAGAYGYYHLYVPTVRKSGSLSLLVASKPVEELFFFFAITWGVSEIFGTSEQFHILGKTGTRWTIYSQYIPFTTLFPTREEPCTNIHVGISQLSSINPYN